MNATVIIPIHEERLSLDAPKRRNFWKKLMTRLAKHATRDTPEGIVVEPTAASLTQWLLGKWGPWGAVLVICGVALYGCWILHNQLVAAKDSEIQVLRHQVEIMEARGR